METTTIETRADFAQWAIERARAIVADQGGDLALAARDMKDDEIATAGNASAKRLSTRCSKCLTA